jgi:hypothetical protein
MEFQLLSLLFTNVKKYIMEDTTQKMKKIPFDLERAKKGEAFRLNKNDSSDNYYFGEVDADIYFWYINEEGNKWVDHETPDNNWHHLIPDEPKAERWAVISIGLLFKSKEDAELFCGNKNNYTVVKLADDE